MIQRAMNEQFAADGYAVVPDLVAVRVHLDDCDERNGALRRCWMSRRAERRAARSSLSPADR
jgi:hypothetical protein